MQRLKIVPITSAGAVRRRLITAVGPVLARVGFTGITEDLVAIEAGCKRADLFRQFQGLPGLVEAFAEKSDYWPSAAELLGDDAETLRRLSPAELVAAFFKRYLRALLRRPQTLDILAWETLSRNDLSRAVEGVRERTALEFFELMDEDPPDDVDLTALVMLMAGGVHFLAVRSRTADCVGGVDLESEAGWRRIEETIDLILSRTLGVRGRRGCGQASETG